MSRFARGKTVCGVIDVLDGFAILPSAHARSTRHERPSQPTPFSAHLRPCLTRDSTSRIGFFVWILCRKLSMREGIRSSSGGCMPVKRTNSSTGGALELPCAEDAISPFGWKIPLIKASRGYFPWKIGHSKIVSALIKCGGIWRESLEDSSVQDVCIVRPASWELGCKCVLGKPDCWASSAYSNSRSARKFPTVFFFFFLSFRFCTAETVQAFPLPFKSSVFAQFILQLSTEISVLTSSINCTLQAINVSL